MIYLLFLPFPVLEITSWAINASLPSGLNFGTNNGTIWGIPTQLFSTSNFTIWANNSGGSISAEINITIVDQIPVLSYSPSTLELTNNTVSSDLPLAPTLTGPGEITSWAINATLPAGLNFEPVTERFGVFQRSCSPPRTSPFGRTTPEVPAVQKLTSPLLTRFQSYPTRQAL